MDQNTPFPQLIAEISILAERALELAGEDAVETPGLEVVRYVSGDLRRLSSGGDEDPQEVRERHGRGLAAVIPDYRDPPTEAEQVTDTFHRAGVGATQLQRSEVAYFKRDEWLTDQLEAALDVIHWSQFVKVLDLLARRTRGDGLEMATNLRTKWGPIAGFPSPRWPERVQRTERILLALRAALADENDDQLRALYEPAVASIRNTLDGETSGAGLEKVRHFGAAVVELLSGLPPDADQEAVARAVADAPIWRHCPLLAVHTAAGEDETVKSRRSLQGLYFGHPLFTDRIRDWVCTYWLERDTLVTDYKSMARALLRRLGVPEQQARNAIPSKKKRAGNSET